MKNKGFSHQDFSVGILVYNAEEQKLIAICRSTTPAATYIYGDKASYSRLTTLRDRLTKKARIHPKTSIHSFIIAIRAAREEHMALLGEREILIL